MAKKDVSKLLWAPWILAIAFIVLLVVVALPDIKGSKDTLERLTAVFPAFITLVILILSRKKTALLGVFFLVFAAAFAAYLIGTGTGATDAFSIMCGIPGIIGVLFILLTKKPAKAVSAAAAAEAKAAAQVEAPAEVPAEEPAVEAAEEVAEEAAEETAEEPAE
jgi:hypothetical protein